MKKYIVFLTFCFLAIGCSDDRQDQIEGIPVSEMQICGTPTPPPPTWFFEAETRNINNMRFYNLYVFIHVVRYSSGSGLDKEIVSSTIINNLNRDYADTSFSFSLLGSEYIDNDDLNRLPSFLITPLFSQNRHSNAIDIYVVSVGRDFNAAGQAQSIPSTACIIKGNYYKESTVAHEVGHCLGLYHTHHGTSVGESGSGTCAELVDGSNSTTCGDYISDTPADPNIWNGCTYIGNITDAHGDSYSPSSSNLMSYAGKSCRTQFTLVQNQRMVNTLEHNYVLQAAIKPWINGADFLATSGIYSVDLADNFDVQWTVECQSYSKQKDDYETYSKQFSGHSITIVNQDDASPSQLYTITMRATLGNKTITETKKAYHVKVYSETGQLRWSTSPDGGSGSTTQVGTINLKDPFNSPVKVYQNGYLYLYYDDSLGGNSVTYPNYYNFQFMEGPGSSFTKPTSANNAFYCPRTVSVGTSSLRAVLCISINGYVNFLSIPIQVLSAIN
ncbi:M43 family zinc metalloprotease [Bacteroides timonensis]|uniref:M43 family zinc metalloprotease n=1 Tax=Bacteroides timonensis TaxID=1470345 RepID=UPI0004B0275F|nr:M43 family zinc metalloprotease [Bacteroides timonensis]